MVKILVNFGLIKLVLKGNLEVFFYKIVFCQECLLKIFFKIVFSKNIF